MCRFTFYLGKPVPLSALVTDPENSLIHQSFHSHEREEPLNGDGFGVAWYVGGHAEPSLFRSITPAWSNSNLRDLARVTTSPCVLAHVRAATQQLEVNEGNCHPFKRGNLAFMHNGDIGGFSRIRRKIINALSDATFEGVRGTTDSEHFFALLCDRVAAERSEVTAEALAGAFDATIRWVVALAREHAPEEHTYLNAVVTDGECAVACRFTTDVPENADSLYVNHGRRYTCEDGLCRMLDPDDGLGAVVISSERLSEDHGWHEVPVNHLVLIAPNRTVSFRRLAIEAATG
ncbi:MAG: class II glutamine amidotransferase [Thermoanaerobaculia bacterium]|nr:class II glutamine amidotransferase [Thermoanaerobaculia bacterium]